MRFGNSSVSKTKSIAQACNRGFTGSLLHCSSKDIFSIFLFRMTKKTSPHQQREARRCRQHRPSISAWYELAAGDLSQNVPVKRVPVLLQNMTHPTPHKSAALFLSYEPSVTHVSVLDFMPSASHERLCLDCWLLSMLSHIHVPPHVLNHNTQGPTDNRSGPRKA